MSLEREVERAKEPDRNFILHPNLAADMTQRHFCHVLYFTPSLPQFQEEENSAPPVYGKSVKETVKMSQNQDIKYGDRKNAVQRPPHVVGMTVGGMREG
jgi:hypothetical protein